MRGIRAFYSRRPEAPAAEGGWNFGSGHTVMITRITAITGAACVLLLPVAAQAYIGPGAGASLAGSFLAVLAAIATAVAIVLFWPLRLLYKKFRGARPTEADGIVSEGDSEDSASPGTAE